MIILLRTIAIVLLIAIARRGGLTSSIQKMIMFYLSNDMIIPGSTYWNMFFGQKPGDALKDEEVLSKDGKIDYEKVKPILFEMPNKQYLSTGKSVGKCWSIGRNYKK